MQVLTGIGEIAIHDGARTILLRPSLAAMASLGTPAEIVETFGGVLAGRLVDCLSVLFACTDKDVTGLFGWFDAEEGKGVVYRPGREPPRHVVALARCLVKHGITGALPPDDHDDAPEYAAEFDARGYVAIAMAHLGLSERQAWNLTMTGLVGALRAKFPPAKRPGSDAPTVAEDAAAMAWLEKVNAMRGGEKLQ